ncbi:MAG: energy-coupling factor transporter ATPase [Bacilli bacterium]|nr:energy-coupling factor transporter ATPase [Bacilli bacterium]
MSIKINNLFYTYFPKTVNQVEALKDISLEIKEGSFNAFIGHTGSGKSTLMQNLNALLIPTSGEVIVDDYKITPNKKKNKNIKQLRKHLGIVFQFPEYQLFEETVEKDVAFGVKNFGADEKTALEKAHEALKAVGLDEKYFLRSPFELSGGEKRRVAIAGILAIDPDILVLDEPTAGLDYVGEVEVMNLVNKMHQEGKTIILVTHDMDLVYRYVENVFVLSHGQLVYSGDPHSLFMTLDESYGLEVPLLFKTARELKEKGYDIDLENVHNIDDLISMMKRGKKDE